MLARGHRGGTVGGRGHRDGPGGRVDTTDVAGAGCVDITGLGEPGVAGGVHGDVARVGNRERRELPVREPVAPDHVVVEVGDPHVSGADGQVAAQRIGVGHLHRCLEALGRHVEAHQGWVVGGDVENPAWALGDVGDDAEVAPVGHVGGELGDVAGRCDACDLGGRGRELGALREPAVAVRTVGDGPRLAVGRRHLELLQRANRRAAAAALPSDSARPPASTVAIAPASTLGMLPPPRIGQRCSGVKIHTHCSPLRIAIA